MVYFHQCLVRINESGVLATSASIQTENGLGPVYAVGKRGVINQSSDAPIENRFNVSYYLDLGKEPVYSMVNTIKNLFSTYPGITLEIGSITGYHCYLTDYSLKVAPNQLVQVSTSFISYEPISGILSPRPTGIPSLYFTGFSGNLAMGWTTHIVSGTSYLTAPTFNFEYNFSANWQPNYLLTKRIPSQIDFFGASERFLFARDTFMHLPDTGILAARNANNAFIRTNGNDADIDFYGYNYINDPSHTNPSMSISLQDAMIQSISMEASVDDIVRSITTVTKYY